MKETNAVEQCLTAVSPGDLAREKQQAENVSGTICSWAV